MVVLDGTGVVGDGVLNGGDDRVVVGLAQILSLDDRVGGQPLVEHRPQHGLLGVFRRDGVVVDEFDQPGELLQAIGDVDDSHVPVVQLAQQAVGDPRRRGVGVELLGDPLVEVRDLLAGSEFIGGLPAQAVLLAEAFSTGVRQFGDRQSLAPVGDPQRRQVGLAEVAVVLLLLFCAHGDGDPL